MDLAPASPGLAARLAGSVAARPYASLALIAALVVAVVALLVYYRGLGPFGPYSERAEDDDAGTTPPAPPPKKAPKKAAAAAADQGDPEVERLISELNS